MNDWPNNNETKQQTLTHQMLSAITLSGGAVVYTHFLIVSNFLTSIS